MLNSYHQSLEWEEDLYRGIKDTLLPKENNLELHVQNMDTKRFPYTDDYRSKLKSLYATVYANTSFDLIISSDNNAYDFLRDFRDELFPGVPIVFCGVNNFHHNQLAKLSKITGVAEIFDARATVNAALKIHPQTEEIFVLNDQLPTGKAWARDIQNELSGLSPKVKITYAGDWSMEQLLEKIEDLPPQTLILLGVYFRDAEGTFFSARESITRMQAAAKVPIYGLLDFYLGHGMVGGNLISGYYQGYAAGQMAKEILEGELIQNIPVQLKGTNRFMFDYMLLTKWGISSDKLPPESLIINEPFSFYQEYKHLVWATLIALSLLSVIITILAFTILGKRRAESALQNAHDNLEFQVLERTSELQQRTRDLRMLLENIPLRVYYKNKQSVYVTCNNAFASDFGLDRRTIPGKTDSDLMSQDKAKVFQRNDIEVMRKNNTQQYEGEHHTAGTTITIRSLKAPMRNEKGEVVGLLGIFWDVTKELAAQKALEASEERFRSLFQGSKAVQLLLSPNGGSIIDANAAAEHFYGYSREQLLTMSIMEINTLSPEEIQAEINRAFQGNDDKFTFCHRLSDGRIRDVEVHAGPVEMLGRPLLYSIVHDVTDQKRLEIELRQAQKLESVGQLAAGIAHEVNTPIQFVGDNLMFLQESVDDLIKLSVLHLQLIDHVKNNSITNEILHKHEKALEDADLEFLNEEIAEAIQQSLEGADRVTDIVRAMKEFAHPGTGNDMVKRDINKAIGSTITLTKNEWRYNAKILTNFSMELPKVPCLLNEFNQVILNMILNARDAIVELTKDYKEFKGEIVIETSSHENHAEIRIKDNGAGMEKDVKDKIFEPFFTTKEVGKGSGQGLAICHSIIVTKHLGELLCDSSPGKGTTFTIRLPLKAKNLVT